MANMRNTLDAPAAARSGETVQEVRDRWAGEVNTSGMEATPMWNEPWTAADTRFGMPPMMGQGNNQTGQMGQMNQMPQGNQMTPMNQMNPMGQMSQMSPTGQTNGLQMSRTGQSPQHSSPNMQNNLSHDVIESPTTVNEAYLGSLKAMLLRNKGNYIVATFLVGTQGTVSWEGILYEVGNDYVTIYQPGRDRYIVNDMYSLRYMEFYDTQRREMCDQILRSNGW